MRRLYPFFILAILFSTVTYSQEMPINFSDAQDNFTVFGGGSFTTTTDPVDTSNTVGEFFNSGAQWEGAFIDLVTEVDLDERQEITLRFYAFDGNAHEVMIKLENGTNPNVEVQVSSVAQSASTWQGEDFTKKLLDF